MKSGFFLPEHTSTAVTREEQLYTSDKDASTEPHPHFAYHTSHVMIYETRKMQTSSRLCQPQPNCTFRLWTSLLFVNVTTGYILSGTDKNSFCDRAYQVQLSLCSLRLTAIYGCCSLTKYLMTLGIGQLFSFSTACLLYCVVSSSRFVRFKPYSVRRTVFNTCGLLCLYSYLYFFSYRNLIYMLIRSNLRREKITRPMNTNMSRFQQSSDKMIWDMLRVKGLFGLSVEAMF